MSPQQYSHPNSATGQLLLDLGGDCDIQACPRCGHAQFDGAKCRCRQTRRPLIDAHLLDGDWTGVQLERIVRRGVRGELVG